MILSQEPIFFVNKESILLIIIIIIPDSRLLGIDLALLAFVRSWWSEVLALKHEGRILGQSSNPESGSRKSQASST